MKTLSEELDSYLTIRRSLGYDLGTTERILRRFTAFAEHEGAGIVSTDLFLRWHEAFGQAHRQTWSARLGIVRLFAQWLNCIDPRHEVPPRSLLPSRRHRPRPHIYSDEEIQHIMAAAAALPSINGLRALTFSTLFGLIAVTGLRINEALSLDVTDVDLEAAVITVGCGKLGKARLLPITKTTTGQLTAYAQERDRLLGDPAGPFFITEQGKRVSDCSARYTFAKVCRSIGVRPSQKFCRHGRGPRIHDLRHTFAVRTLVNWYRTSQDPGREMIKLTTYLGHTNPAHTYWYIEAIPELLDLASRRMEKEMRL